MAMFQDRELGLGAVAYGGMMVFNDELLAPLRLTEDALDLVRERALAELRERLHRQGDASAEVAGTTVVIVDHGVEIVARLRPAVLATRGAGGGVHSTHEDLSRSLGRRASAR